jgi:hypothetical protein
LDNHQFYLYSDQATFFANSNSLGNSSSIIDIYNQCFVQRVHLESEGAYFIFGLISYIAKKFFDGNSVIIQSLIVCLFAIISILFVFKTILLFIPLEKVKKYLYSFALLTPIFYYSPWILRDIHIACFYSIAIYIVFSKLTLIKVLLFIVLFYFIAEFRIEHALFLLSFPLVQLFKLRDTYKWVKSAWAFIFILGIFGFISLYYLFFDELKVSNSLIERYTSYTIDNLDQDGFASKIYLLPSGIREFFIVLNSQISPIPPWLGIESSKSIYDLIVGIVLLITTVYWATVFLFIFFSMTLKKAYRCVPKSILVFLSLTILFLILNSANMNTRRILGMYPVFFLVYIVIKESLSIRQIRNMNILSWITYTLVLFTYFILKAI